MITSGVSAVAVPLSSNPRRARRTRRGRGRARRTAVHLVVVLVLVSIGSFLMLDRLPGDPAYALLGDTATPEQVAMVHRDLHLDRALPVRYALWLGDVLRGDFGQSYRTGQSTWEAVTERLPTTFELIVVSQVFSLLVAIPLAVWASHRRGGLFDRISGTVAFVFISAPTFVLGVVFVLALAVRWHLLPASGWESLSSSVTGNLRSIALPSATLALAGPLPTYFRLLRSDMIDTLQQDYIEMAQAKGLSARYILWRHALRPSSVSLVTIAGVQVGRMLGGAVIVETLFALPGLGRLITTSISSRELVVLQGGVLLIAVTCVAINVLVDLVYPLLDPRVRDDHG